jgi:hypothetical protein
MVGGSSTVGRHRPQMPARLTIAVIAPWRSTRRPCGSLHGGAAATTLRTGGLLRAWHGSRRRGHPPQRPQSLAHADRL